MTHRWQKVRKPFIALLFLVTLILALHFFKGLNISQVLSDLGHFSWRVIAGVIGLVFIQILIQGTRFWLLLPKDRKPSWKGLFYVFSVGQWMNLFAPARAGDVMKVVLLSSQDQKQENQLSIMDSSVSLIADKCVDVIALILLLGITQPVFSSSYLWIGVLSVFFLVGMILILRKARFLLGSPRLQQIKSSFLSVWNILRHPQLATLVLLLGILAWIAEGLALNILCVALGFHIPFSGMILVLTILNLGIAIPVSFANLGPFEAAMTFGLGQYQIPMTEALAIATAHHLLQMLGITLLAAYAWLGMRLPRYFRVSGSGKQKALNHYASLAHQYNDHVEKGFLKFLRNRERSMVLSFAEMEKCRGSMIDVGCGGGFYSLIGKKLGLQVCAVDAVPEMVAHIKDQVDRVEVSDIESMTSQDCYDLVICAGVLDFTKNPVQAFKNLCTLVAPGGRLVILAPRSGISGLLYRVEKWFFGMSVNGFSKSWLRHHAHANGFYLVRHGHPLPTNFVAEFRHMN